VKATEVTAGLAESNGSLLSGLWRDSLHVTCGLTACTPGSARGPTLGNEYGENLPFKPMFIVCGPICAAKAELAGNCIIARLKLFAAKSVLKIHLKQM